MSAPIRIDLTAATPTEVPADDLAAGEATLAWLCPVCGSSACSKAVVRPASAIRTNAGNAVVGSRLHHRFRRLSPDAAPGARVSAP